MACIENIPPANADSEMEEGEIVDDLDDISSDEELLLRQRLHVLETYNNVLERKKASDVSLSGDKDRCDLSRDLSEISASELEDNKNNLYRNVKGKHFKTHTKHKKRKEQIPLKSSSKSKDYKKKIHRKKKLEIKIISESSEESDDEYRNKRRKLANAVSFNNQRSDTSSLSARLKKMICASQVGELKKSICTEDKQTETDINFKLPEVTLLLSDESLQDKPKNDCIENTKLLKDLPKLNVGSKESPKVYDLIDLCNDDDDKIISKNEHIIETVDSVFGKNEDKKNPSDSEEDLELLRQHALKTKSSKLKTPPLEISNEIENKPIKLPEDEDSYTAELRLICLKSAYLKKAFEIKRKQKLKKRLSQSSILQDRHVTELDMLPNKTDSRNDTDIESVDMDIGSDGDEKLKELSADGNKNNSMINDAEIISNRNISIEKPQEDELEEDEDLLRAKLLTSLSKNLPNLIDSNILDSIQEVSNTNKQKPVEQGKKIGNANVPEPKKFIIQLGESDSEGEHEATKNLTKMHIKQQQATFEQQLDLFLKCTRMEVERQLQPQVQEPPVQTPEKFVPKSVKHLPKSEQIEYKNLVKRMAELEKIKQSRQVSISAVNPPIKSNKFNPVKETLKPRNASMDTIDEQIAASRKKIAEESANINRLKEEATKLIRKHKIVTTELKNIATAIVLNKKQQKSVITRLSKIRAQHQMLLKSSTFTNSQTNSFLPPTNRPNNKMITVTKLQKENNPQKEDHRNPQILKSMMISVVNDFKENNDVDSRLSVQVDVTNNKKVVKASKSPIKQISSDSIEVSPNTNGINENGKCDNSEIAAAEQPVVDKGGGKRKNSEETVNNMNKEEKRRKNDGDDYKSPLDALHTTNWEEDPNAVLCPFEVGGNCKDPDCKYLHPKLPPVQ